MRILGYILVPTAVSLINTSASASSIISNLFFYILITPVFGQSIMRSMYLQQALGQAKEAVCRLQDLTNVEQLPVKKTSQKIRGNSISFKNVVFKYPDANKNAVDGLSFTVPEGKTVAMVGVSGGGKTSIARLIPRFWDVDKGQICIGGMDVKDIYPQVLMKQVSFVFQNTKLFKASILQNIKLGNPKAKQEEVERLLDLTRSREIINKLPNGLNTKIGVDGTYLSGGEQQRISLVRAILKNAPIVLLDEATAFTDPENEHLVQEALKLLCKNKTVLMIAHRLTGVQDVDEILVIDKGKIVEQGSHQELLNKNEIYASMWKEYQRSAQWTIGKEAQYV
ncbi:ABC transporter ATP-binding protein [Marinifilum sp.]|uniref:ABC transporter ATP-binding protein n=1 Tax=Marinifilum sp. TaxID=2033137 RepID=UPI003BAC3C41